MTKGQAMVLRMNVLWYNKFMLDIDYILCKKQLDPGRRLADEIWVDLKNFKILYRINHLDFHFIYYQCNVIIVLPIHFSWLFLIKLFKVYFEVCKIRLLFFHVDSKY